MCSARCETVLEAESHGATKSTNDDKERIEIMKEAITAIAILALGCSCIAQSGSPIATSEQSQAAAIQQRAVEGASSSLAPIQTCNLTFTSGAGNTFLSSCITPNGNITRLETPQGFLQINHILPFPIDGGEGYGFCDVNAATAYFDYAYTDSANWGATSVVSQTATSIKLARTTADGIWTLTQTITQVPPTASLKVAMALKNNTAVARTVNLLRYANIDADNFNFNFGSGTGNGAFIWNVSPDPASLTQRNGLALQNIGTPQLPAWDGFVQSTVFGPNPCAFAANWAGATPTDDDLSAVLAYSGTVPAKGTKTVTVSYKGM
jgi:hypothetical protein